MLNPHKKSINFIDANVRKNCRETVKINHSFLKKCRDNKDITGKISHHLKIFSNFIGLLNTKKLCVDENFVSNF